MIRFPNPGSDIMQMINIFKLLYVNLSNFNYFDLNNMTYIMTNENVASSSGYIGAQALEKSYETEDYSRNPLYNQAKMYAEVYRFLGWITSSEDAALKYNFTYLGIHVALSGDAATDIFEQSVLGINYPNQILNVKFADINKPFVSMLLAAKNLNNLICRDEILIGPMNLSNGYDDNEFNNMIMIIKDLRKTKEYKNLTNKIDELASELNIAVNTMKNYTRFVISTLVFTGWMKKVRSSVYGRMTDFLELTEKGKNVISQLEQMVSIDGNKLLEEKDIVIKSTSKISFFKMLERAGFIVSEELQKLEYEKEVVLSKFGSENILFSPFQFFNKRNIEKMFPEIYIETSSEELGFNITNTGMTNYIFTTNKVIEPKDVENIDQNKARKMLEESLKKNNLDLEKSIIELDEIFRTMKQTEFYPFVSDLLSIIFGRKVRTPQSGVNNERFDLIIPDKEFSIPVEVKSPTEEEMLSVKAIRQALENKIVILSRYQEHYPTKFEISTIAVGYRVPNDRSDVHKLIEDINSVFGIYVSIIDIVSLLRASYTCIINKKIYLVSDFIEVKGVINFENL